MTPEIAYFLKVNLAIAIFYAFYRLFFYKDTFFRLRRTILLAFFCIAFIYPFFNIQEWIKEQEPIADVVNLYATMLPEITPTPEATKENWTDIASTIAFYGYIGGILFLAIRFFAQLSSIFILVSKCKKEEFYNTPVRLLNKPAGPFSFFKFIFIHKESHSLKETEEILIHENTHACQYHSIDVIVSELLSIACWINPFIWLLKREVRHNLEYLADNTVLQAGCDSRSYQYHLLGLAHHQSTANIYNSFNVLHLKNRISMMNKKRSKKIGRTKYFMFIPLAGMLMLFSNIEAIARVTKSLAEKISDNGIDLKTKILSHTTVNDTLPTKNITQEVVVIASRKNTPVDKNGPTSQRVKQVYSTVDKRPQFPGGDDQLLAYINSNIKYPVAAQEKGIQGKVTLGFVINKDGHISNIEALSESDESLVAEAKRLIRSMPNWVPGELNGEQVSVKHVLPVTFRLTGADSSLKDKLTTAGPNGSESNSSNTVFTVVEKMPQYEGGDEALIKYINSSIKYPDEAFKNGIQGRVYCEFVIKEDGSISNCVVKRGVDPSLDNEALRIIKNMPGWEPGIQKGRKVSVRYTVPITFRIDNQVYTNVDVMPSFPGGEAELKQFLSVRHSKEIAASGTEPTHPYCSFIINEDGSIGDAKIENSVEPSIDKLMLEKITKMPKWNPGTKNGRTVKVKYIVPLSIAI